MDNTQLNGKDDCVNACILNPTDENIELCAKRILNGDIVGIPTETVYGLAASALNPDAINKIFVYKGRPLSDPIIIHVSSLEMCDDLVDIDKETKQLFTTLTNKYWPGPLTIVLKANPNKIDPILNAGTGFIGLRLPNNKITQRLIELGGPIGAPSANKFCHISPVNPFHVLNDFKEFDVKILDGGVTNCSIESTVIKPDVINKKIEILRMGFLSKAEIQSFLQTTDEYKDFSVDIKFKHHENTKQHQENKVYQANRHEINESTNNDLDIYENQEAPGQFLKHYSPLIDTYILDNENGSFELSSSSLNEIILLDFNGVVQKQYGRVFGFIKDLSENGDEKEVIKNLYDYLHWSETCLHAKMLVICNIPDILDKSAIHYETIKDRVYKVSSSKRIKIIEK